VKTRLGLAPAVAARLQTEFVKRTLQTVWMLRDEAELELSLDYPCSEWAEFPIARTIQIEGDLGERLYATLRGGLEEGRPRVVILGSDSPTIPPEHIRALLDAKADVTLGPTVDGGYYGIGCGKLIGNMFAGVRWSSRGALEDTVRAAKSGGLTVSLGPEWFDVDTAEDLRFLLESTAGDEGIGRIRSAVDLPCRSGLFSFPGF
jgi:glycosyltransferase A (GT-A) superfamily protein (DUF2064 family)